VKYQVLSTDLYDSGKKAKKAKKTLKKKVNFFSSNKATTTKKRTTTTTTKNAQEKARGVQYDNTTPKDHVTDKHYGLKHFMGQLTYEFFHESIQRPRRPG
jgi:hypothetical protein